MNFGTESRRSIYDVYFESGTFGNHYYYYLLLCRIIHHFWPVSRAKMIHDLLPRAGGQIRFLPIRFLICIRAHQMVSVRMWGQLGVRQRSFGFKATMASPDCRREASRITGGGGGGVVIAGKLKRCFLMHSPNRFTHQNIPAVFFIRPVRDCFNSAHLSYVGFCCHQDVSSAL